jgi:hypothetical protein
MSQQSPSERINLRKKYRSFIQQLEGEGALHHNEQTTGRSYLLNFSPSLLPFFLDLTQMGGLIWFFLTPRDSTGDWPTVTSFSTEVLTASSAISSLPFHFASRS